MGVLVHQQVEQRGDDAGHEQPDQRQGEVDRAPVPVVLAGQQHGQTDADQPEQDRDGGGAGLVEIFFITLLLFL